MKPHYMLKFGNGSENPLNYKAYELMAALQFKLNSKSQKVKIATQFLRGYTKYF